MPAAGQTKVNFNDKFFDDILHSAGVENICLSKAQQALANQRETMKRESAQARSQRRADEAEARFEQRKLKRKQKHRGH